MSPEHDDKPWALGRIFGIRAGTVAFLAGFVVMQLGLEGIAPLAWDSPAATCVAGFCLQLAGLTWNGLSYLLERLERR